VNTSDIDEDDYLIYISCAPSDPLRKYETGLNPKLCIADSDCIRLDGTVASCTCAIDGNSYCTPDPFDDSLISWYWTLCSESKMTTVQQTHRDWMLTVWNDAQVNLDCYQEFPDYVKFQSDYEDLVEEEDDDFSLVLASLAAFFVLN
jgi:hypothetical protein